ncbi:MAG: glycosyltransferase [Planctomycetes bacterium]|nr:glycosyltransferase [Planctomycetota bacterium]
MTMFGWAETGGGTIFPRLIARELAERGHAVQVVYAAQEPLSGAGPYATRAHDDGGVRLLAIHNRPTPFLDDRAPARELHDPEPVRLVDEAVRSFRPDLVHFHNFLGLSAGIAAAVRARGVASCCSLHNFWALCPTLYLQLPALEVCAGVAADGANCLACTRAEIPGTHYVARAERIRAALVENVGLCLPGSAAVRDTLRAHGYPDAWMRVLPLQNPRAERLHAEVGRQRAAGVATPLRFGFLGSVLPIKGVHLLVGAAQALRGECEVHVFGDGPRDYLDAMRRLDTRRRVRFHGAFDAATLPRAVAAFDVGVVPSVCLDHSPQVIGEMQAAGVPVLGARIGGIPEYVQPGAGELFAPGDMAALAIAMQRLLDAPQRVVDWQRRLRPPPSFAGYVDELLSIYQELLAGRPLA